MASGSDWAAWLSPTVDGDYRVEFTMAHISNEMRECINECTTCHQVCISTIQHCLQKGGMHAEQPHVRLLADCAQICAVSADFMLRGSQHHPHTCGECAEICDDCARDCDRMAN